MADFGAFTGPSSSVVGSAQFQVTTDASQLDAGLADVHRKVRTSMNGITKLMTGVAVAGAAGLAAGFAKYFKTATKQQHAFAETFTLLPKTSKEEFAKIEKQAKNLAARMNVTWEDMSKGLYNAISAGIPKENIISFMENAAKGAIGGVATLNEAVNVGTTALNAMTAQGYETNEVFDILFSTVRKGKTTLPELASSIGFVLPVANAFGVSLEEVSAMISTLTASGIRTRVAMTSIRAGLSELYDPAYKAGKALQENIGASFEQLISSGKDVGQILNMLYKAVGREEFAKLFGLESRAGILALTGAGYEKYAEDLIDARNSAGATEMAFEKMADVVAFKMGVMAKTLNQTFTDIASKAIPLVGELFDEKLLPAAVKLQTWFTNNEDMIGKWFEDTWDSAFPVIEDFINGFITLGKAAWKFISFITENKALMIGALTAIGFAMTAAFGPTAPIIIGTGLLITLLGDLKEKWDDIVKSNPSGTWFQHGQKLLLAVADGMKSAAVSLYNALFDSLMGLRKLLPFSDAEEGPLSDLTASGAAIPKTLAEGIDKERLAVRDAIYDTLYTAYAEFSGWAFHWYDVGHNISTTIAEGIVGGAVAVYDALVDVFNELVSLLPFSDADEGPLASLTRSGKSIIITLANGVKVSSSVLGEEVETALEGVETALLGNEWLPTQSELDNAISNRISFTSFIERGEGLIQSIDWGAQVGTSVAGALGGPSFPDAEKAIGGWGGGTARIKKKKEEKKKKGAGGFSEATEEMKKEMDEAIEDIKDKIQDAFTPKIDVDAITDPFQEVISWIAENVATAVVWLPTWDEVKRSADNIFSAVKWYIDVFIRQATAWLPTWDKFRIEAENTVGGALRWIQDKVAVAEEWMPDSGGLRTAAAKAFGAAIAWAKEAFKTLFMIEEEVIFDEFGLLDPEGERGTEKRLVFFPEISESDIANAFGKVHEWIKEFIADPLGWIPTPAEALDATKKAFQGVVDWITDALKVVFIIEEPDIGDELYAQELPDVTQITRRRLWFFPNITEDDIRQTFGVVVDWIKKFVAVAFVWVPLITIASAAIAFLGVSLFIKYSIRKASKWLPSWQDVKDTAGIVFDSVLDWIADNLTKVADIWFPEKNIFETAVDNTFGAVSTWVTNNIAKATGWLPTFSDIQSAAGNVFAGAKNWIGDNIATVDSWLPKFDNAPLGLSFLEKSPEQKMKEAAGRIFKGVLLWIGENVAKAAIWLPTLIIRGAAGSVSQLFGAVGEWIDADINDPSTWLPSITLEEVGDAFNNVLQWVKDEFNKAGTWLPVIGGQEVGEEWLPTITTDDIGDAFKAIPDWVADNVANAIKWLPTYEDIKETATNVFKAILDWIADNLTKVADIWFPEKTIWDTTIETVFGGVKTWIGDNIAKAAEWLPSWADLKEYAGYRFSAVKSWVEDNIAKAVKWLPTETIQEIKTKAGETFKGVEDWVTEKIATIDSWLPPDDITKIKEAAGKIFKGIVDWIVDNVAKAVTWLPTLEDVESSVGAIFTGAKTWIADNIAKAVTWLPTLEDVESSVGAIFTGVKTWVGDNVAKATEWLPTLEDVESSVSAIFTGAKTWVGDNVAKATEWLPTLEDVESSVSAIFTGVKTWITDNIAKATEWLPTLEDVESSVSAVFTGVKTWVGDNVAKATEWLPTLEDVESSVSAIFTGVKTWITDNIAKATEWLPTLEDVESSVSAVFTGVKTWITDNIAKAVTWLPTLEDVESSVSAIFTGAKTWITDNVAKAVAWLPTLEDVESSVGAIFTGVKTWITDNIAKATEWLPTLEDVESSVSAIFTGAKTWITDNVAKAVAWLPTLEDVESSVGAIFTGVKTWITDNIAKATEWLPTLEDVESSVSAIFTGAKTWITDNVAKAVAWLPTLEDVESSVGAIFTGVKTWITDNIAKATEWLPTLEDVESSVSAIFTGAKTWITDNVAKAVAWLPTLEDVESSVGAIFTGVKTWITDNIAKATEWLPTFEEIETTVKNVFKAAKTWIDDNIGKSSVWLPSWLDLRISMGGRFDAAVRWIKNNIGQAKEWLPTLDDVKTVSAGRFKAALTWIKDNIAKANKWLPTYDDISTWADTRFKAALSWIRTYIAKATEWLPTFDDISTWADIKFKAALTWIRDNIAKAKEWIPSWQDIMDYAKWRFQAAIVWIKNNVAKAKGWLPTWADVFKYAGYRLDGALHWVQTVVKQAKVWLPSWETVKTRAGEVFTAAKEWVTDNIAKVAAWMPTWSDIYNSMDDTFSAVRSWIRDKIALASVWLPSQESLDTWAGTRFGAVKDWIKNNIARWDVWFPSLSPSETPTQKRQREERIATGEEGDPTQDHPLIQSLGPLLRLLSLKISQEQISKFFDDTKLWELVRYLGPWNTVKDASGETQLRQRAPANVGPKGKLANLSVAGLLRSLLGLGTKAAQVELINIWFPYVTEADIEDKWKEVRTWIQTNISDAWLSDSTKEALANFTNFMIGAGVEGGLINTLGKQIQQLALSAEDLKKISEEGVDVNFQFVAGKVGEGAGQGVLRGAEIAGSLLFNEAGMIGLFAGIASRIPWLKNVILTKGNITAFIIISLVGLIDTFVLEPAYGSGPAFEGESIWLGFFRRMLSPIVGEDLANLTSGMLYEEGGILKILGGFAIRPFLNLFKTNDELVAEAMQAALDEEERKKTYMKDYAPAIESFVRRTYGDIDEVMNDALIQGFINNPESKPGVFGLLGNLGDSARDWLKERNSWQANAALWVMDHILPDISSSRELAKERNRKWIEDIWLSIFPQDAEVAARNAFYQGVGIKSWFSRFIDAAVAGATTMMRAEIERLRTVMISAVERSFGVWPGMGERAETARTELDGFIETFVYMSFPTNQMAELFRTYLDDNGDSLINIVKGIFYAFYTDMKINLVKLLAYTMPAEAKEIFTQSVDGEETGIIGIFSGFIQAHIDSIKYGVIDLLALLMPTDRLKEFFLGRIEEDGIGFGNIIKSFFAAFIDDAKHNIVTVIAGILPGETLKNLFLDNIMEGDGSFGNIISSVIGAFTERTQMGITGDKDTSIFDPLKEAVGGIFSWIWEQITGLFTWENFMKSPAQTIIGDKLPEQLQLGLNQGLMGGMLSGNMTLGVMGGLIQGMVWWMADQIIDIDLDWTSVKDAVFGAFNPSNWFNVDEAVEGEEATGFASLIPSWSSILSTMLENTVGWIPDLISGFIPEGGWKAKVEDKFGGMIEGAQNIANNITGVFESMKTTISGVFDVIKRYWNRIADIVNKGVGWMPGVDSPVPTFDLGHNIGRSDEVYGGYKNAKGGLFMKPRWGVLAEAGPELNIPLERLGEILNRAGVMTDNMRPAHAVHGAGNGSSSPIIFQVEGDIYGIEDFEDKVGETLVDLQRDGKVSFATR